MGEKYKLGGEEEVELDPILRATHCHLKLQQMSPTPRRFVPETDHLPWV
jgi:hypothetical protein